MSSIEAIQTAAKDMHSEAVDIVAGLRTISKMAIREELEEEDFSAMPYMALVDAVADKTQKAADALEKALMELSRARQAEVSV